MISESWAGKLRPQTSVPPRFLHRPAHRPNGATGSYQPTASCCGQHDLAFIGAPCRVAKRLHDVVALQVGEVGQDFVDAATCADLADYHADRDAHSADARLATHDLGLLGDAIELTHVAAPYRNSLHSIGSRKESQEPFTKMTGPEHQSLFSFCDLWRGRLPHPATQCRPRPLISPPCPHEPLSSSPPCASMTLFRAAHAPPMGLQKNRKPPAWNPDSLANILHLREI